MSRNHTLPKPYKNQVYDLSLVHNFLFSFYYWIPFLSITGTPILDVYQNVHSKVWIFPLLNYFGGHSVLFCLTTDTSVLGDVFPGLQNLGRYSKLYSLLLEHDGFLRFNSGGTPADLLIVNMVLNPFKHLLFQATGRGENSLDNMN